MRGAFERKEILFLRIEKIIYTVHMILPLKWSSSPMKLKNQDLGPT